MGGRFSTSGEYMKTSRKLRNLKDVATSENLATSSAFFLDFNDV
jgi:hypothetical protein